MAKGGVRPGSGRPKGRKDDTTLKREKVEAALKQRIMRVAQRILDKQLALAEGCNYLMRVTTITPKKGASRKEVTIVTDPAVISAYFDETLEDTKEDNEYFYITADKPDNRALENILDRGFGKPSQSVDHTSGGKSLEEVLTTVLNGIRNQSKGIDSPEVSQ